MTLTPARLDEIRARLAVALTGEPYSGVDLKLHAVGDIADLLAEVERLRGDNAELRAKRKECSDLQVKVRDLEEVITALRGGRIADALGAEAQRLGMYGNAPDSRASSPASPVGTPGQGGAGQDALQGSAERLERCRAALERAWGLCADPQVPSRVVLCIRRGLEADSCYIAEEVDRAIAACKTAGLWEAAVNRPSQGVRLSPLANALLDARDALDKQG